ncbi:MAG: hypothetical protein AAFN41_02045, partial [Planctomycetota bacterium]
VKLFRVGDADDLHIAIVGPAGVVEQVRDDQSHACAGDQQQRGDREVRFGEQRSAFVAMRV